jgi:hypothetical protein
MSFGVVQGTVRMVENCYRLMISVQYQSSLTPLATHHPKQSGAMVV